MFNAWQTLYPPVRNVECRSINALATHFGAVGYHAFSDGPSTELVRRHFGPDTPPVPEITLRRTALVLVNAHHSLTQPRPTVPNAVEVGGLHITQPAELENAANVSIIHSGVGSIGIAPNKL